MKENAPHFNLSPHQVLCALLSSLKAQKHNISWCLKVLSRKVYFWIKCICLGMVWWTLDWIVLVQALIVSCHWARHFIPTVPLLCQVSKWVLAKLMLRVNLQWTSIQSVGEYTPSHFMLWTLQISTDLMALRGIPYKKGNGAFWNFDNTPREVPRPSFVGAGGKIS